MIELSAADCAVYAPQGLRRAPSGDRLERFPPPLAELLRNQTGPLANLRSSSGCALVLSTDAPWIELRLKRLRHHQHAGVGIDCEIISADGVQVTASPDLRPCSGDCTLRFATGRERGGALATCWLWLPLISACAIAGLALPAGSTWQRPDLPAPTWLALGDSLTQGFSVPAPTQHWLHRVMRARNWPVWNCGLGGLQIEPAVCDWALRSREWAMITVGLGSNHAWRAADVATVGARASALLEGIARQQPQARVVWLLPPWKALEAGQGPPDFAGVPLDAAAAQRIAAIRTGLQQVLDDHGIAWVGDLMPADHRLLPDGLHPQALGMQHYAAAFMQAVP